MLKLRILEVLIIIVAYEVVFYKGQEDLLF
jgi:hypothetical protein